jgi:nitrate/TMAO reductase-like tetraheme cytochrome c subunit
MYVVLLLFTALAVIAVLVLAGVSAGIKPNKTRRAFVFLALAALPGLWTLGLLVRADATMKTNRFCLRCHEMGPFAESMESGDPNLLAASHYTNDWVNRERACYDCHTEKSVRGAIEAKLTGMHDMRVHYLGTIPDTIVLRKPYGSRICLSCHGEASIVELAGHPSGLLDEIEEDLTSCLDCHGPGH